jgi:hypothetical protein
MPHAPAWRARRDALGVLASDAMLARRLPLLWVFAGGCLSGAALIHFWRGDAEVILPPAQAMIERAATPPPLATASAQAPAVSPEAVSATPAGPEHTDDVSASPPEQGHSVAEVLARLETEYRQGLVAGTPAGAVSAVRDDVAPAATAAPQPAPGPEPAPAVIAAVPPAPTHEAAVRELPAREEPSVALVAAVTTATPPAAVHVSNVDIGAVHIGDVHQNTQVSYVQQNDAYLLHLALLQNLQLLALSPYARLSPPASPAHRPNGTTRRPPAFPSSLTNPDNPWGFDFPPTILAK